MLRLLDTEVRRALKERQGDGRVLKVTLATGKLAGHIWKDAWNLSGRSFLRCIQR